MRPSRPASVLAVAVLAASTLALSDPVLDPEAPASCWLARGADTPEDASDDLELCREDVWFHDPGTKVGNAGSETGFASWDTTPPDTSVTGGAGGGALATSASHQFVEPFDDRTAMVAEGVFEGILDTLAVELYLFPPAGMAQQETSFRVDALLQVDGKNVAQLGDLVVPMETAGDAVQRISFAWTSIANKMERLKLPLGGTHAVKLVVHGTGLATNGAVFVYDTTEVPAGMVFNIDPAELEGTPARKA